jgi:hypothetical protein
MNLTTENYQEQSARWPKDGRHILAQFDNTSIVVYQAYCPAIGRYAAEHEQFGGGFSFDRMSWIKPNFLWMMYRCGWATKQNQEAVLAVRIRRDGFDEILRQAVPSTFVPGLYESESAWQESLRKSSVRLQWDPDHDPHGHKLPRRAIQLGLRGDVLKSYGCDWIVSIEDISEFVSAQFAALNEQVIEALTTPTEDVYPVDDPQVRKTLGMDHSRTHT